MFRDWEIWRHRNCLDIDLLVIKRMYSGQEYIKIKARLIKQGKPNWFFDNGPVTYKIYRKDFKNWRLVNGF